MIHESDNANSVIRWAVIGPGQIAHHFVNDMPLAIKSRNEVVGVMSNDLGEAKEFAEKYHIDYYSDSLENMLENSRPDIVYIATPHAAHFKQASGCLKHRVGVLCEKPCTLNEKQATELIRIAREYHTFLMEGMWIRFLPDFKLIIDLLEQNIIGKLNSVVADMSYKAPEDSGSRFYNPALGGGSLLDLGIYPVYLSLLTLGIPDRIKAVALLSEKRIDKSCAVIFEYTSRAYALLESSIIKNTHKQAIIYGENGMIWIKEPWNEKPSSLLVSLYDGAEIEYPFEWQGRGFQYEIDAVTDCLVHGLIECPLHDYQKSLALIRLMDEIRAQTGITYPFEE